MVHHAPTVQRETGLLNTGQNEGLVGSVCSPWPGKWKFLGFKRMYSCIGRLNLAADLKEKTETVFLTFDRYILMGGIVALNLLIRVQRRKLTKPERQTAQYHHG